MVGDSLFRIFISGIEYLQECSRGDITFTIAERTKQHWQRVKNRAYLNNEHITIQQ